MGVIELLIVGILFSVLVATDLDPASWLTRRIIRYAVRRLPGDLRERYFEEWLAESEQFSNSTRRLLFALDLIRGSFRIRASFGGRRQYTVRSFGIGSIISSSGGIALMVPLVLVAIAEAVWYGPTGSIFVVLAMGGFGSLLIGWFDAKDHVPPEVHLLVSCSFCGSLVILQPDLILTEIDLAPDQVVSLGIIAVPFTIVCLLGLQNAINTTDGMSGLVLGLSAFWTGCLMFYAPDQLQLYLRFMLLGLLILLPFNIRDSLFLGDAGRCSIGATIGLLMIYCFNAGDGKLPMLTVVLWLFVPVADTLRVMTTRLMNDRSPLVGDKNHLHHRLKRRWDATQSLVIYLGLAGVPGLAAAAWPVLTEPLLLLVMAGYAGLVWWTRGGGDGGTRDRADFVLATIRG